MATVAEGCLRDDAAAADELAVAGGEVTLLPAGALDVVGVAGTVSPRDGSPSRRSPPSLESLRRVGDDAPPSPTPVSPPPSLEVEGSGVCVCVCVCVYCIAQ